MLSGKNRNKILPQMFDVRPVDSDGCLDLEKINNVSKASKIKIKNSINYSQNLDTNAVYDVKRPTPLEDEKRRFQEFIQAEKNRRKQREIQEESMLRKEELERQKKIILQRKKQEEALRFIQVKQREIEYARQREIEQKMQVEIGKAERIKQENAQQEERREREKEHYKLKLEQEKFVELQKKVLSKKHKEARGFFWKNKIDQFRGKIFAIFLFRKKLERSQNYSYFVKENRKKYISPFFAMSVGIFLFVFGVAFFYHGLKVRGLALENGELAYANLTEAKNEISNRNFNQASVSFNDAYARFSEIQTNINSLGKIIVEASRFIPYFSKLSSGSHLVLAGKDIASIGELSTETLKILDGIKNPIKDGESVSYLKIFQDSNQNIVEISAKMDDLENNLNEINLDDVPASERTQFIDLKQKLPEISKFMTSFSQEEKVLADVLGGNGPRKYLFLFQNNQEIRATGGFIGTYAVLDIFNGRIKNFFVDGIFNPDGQLREKVIPPAPIQKISAAWSLHDSNWFPNFPTSAEKASWFYEKTGGPTVDGVITMTPTVMQRLLEITGPIEMPEYGVTIDKDNFLENIQTEVEVNYDKNLNQPKKILADLAPKILDRIFNAKGITDLTKTLDIVLSSLNEKHILIYSKNYDIEKILSNNGWSGEILSTRKDYLSVINTNINGYKTDGVIDESISHKAEIKSDGSIIDTVSITRHHNGGNTPYDWWNKVNADYMRVYVPKGATLISVSGQTKEFDSPPLDYKSLGFKQDPQLNMEEGSQIIDKESGTRIYEDSGKTVFANWVYVSPQETATIKYSYLLPFKLDTNLTANPSESYSVLFQKQSGSLGSAISSTIVYPNFYKLIWKYPEQNVSNSSEDGKAAVSLSDKLNTDKFFGLAFEKNQ
jgi:hypothetical protein